MGESKVLQAVVGELGLMWVNIDNCGRLWATAGECGLGVLFGQGL